MAGLRGRGLTQPGAGGTPWRRPAAGRRRYRPPARPLGQLESPGPRNVPPALLPRDGGRRPQKRGAGPQSPRNTAAGEARGPAVEWGPRRRPLAAERRRCSQVPRGPADLGRGRPIPRLRLRFPGSFKFESPGGGAGASGTAVVERRGGAARAEPWRRGRRGR